MRDTPIPNVKMRVIRDHRPPHDKMLMLTTIMPPPPEGHRDRDGNVELSVVVGEDKVREFIRLVEEELAQTASAVGWSKVSTSKPWMTK